jgi:hypothetical protein
MAESAKVPKVFISYAWESDINKWVADFATRLRNEGVAAVLDQWETNLGDPLPQFMEKAVRESDFVLLICTPRYREKSDSRKGGVGYEGHIITAEIFTKSNDRKFIPVLRKGDGDSAIPSWAQGKRYIDLSGNPYKEENYRELLITLLGKKPHPPPVGLPPDFRSDDDESAPLRPLAGLAALRASLLRSFAAKAIVLYKRFLGIGVTSLVMIAIMILGVRIWSARFMSLDSTINPGGTLLPGTVIAVTDSFTPPATTDIPRTLTPTLNTQKTTLESDAPTEISLTQGFSAPGSGAQGITLDGTTLWSSDDSGVIFVMDTSGKVLDSIEAPGVTPMGITWDGTSLWLFTTNDFLIYQFQVDQEVTHVVSSFPAPTNFFGGDITQDLAWDGKSLWYANQFKVYNLDTSGEVLKSFTFPKNVTGLDWDGSNLWIAFNDFPENATLNKVNTSGDILATYPSTIFQINSLAWSDGHLWALGIDSLGGKPMIYKLDLAS